MEQSEDLLSKRWVTASNQEATILCLFTGCSVTQTSLVTVQPGVNYIVKIEKIKNLLVRFIHQKIFFNSILVIDFEIVYKFSDLYAFFKIFLEISTFLFTENHKNIQVIHRHYDECKNPYIRKKQFIMLL